MDGENLQEASQLTCPKCGNPLSDIQTTKTGRQLRRCSTGNWNEETKQIEGCDYVEWLSVAPVELDEKCPKCGSPLLLATTRFGKKLKKCSTNKWDPDARQAVGCDYVEWQRGNREELDEDCPVCNSKLIMYTTSSGKRLKKCSTQKWDPVQKMATGCEFVEWQK